MQQFGKLVEYEQHRLGGGDLGQVIKRVTPVPVRAGREIPQAL